MKRKLFNTFSIKISPIKYEEGRFFQLVTIYNENNQVTTFDRYPSESLKESKGRAIQILNNLNLIK